jgi:hypothetical protein
VRTEIRDKNAILVGTVSLNGDGMAVLGSDASERLCEFIASLDVIVPSEGGTIVVKPEDGEVYLRGLPFELRGPLLSATFIA